MKRTFHAVLFLIAAGCACCACDGAADAPDTAAGDVARDEIAGGDAAGSDGAGGDAADADSPAGDAAALDASGADVAPIGAVLTCRKRAAVGGVPRGTLLARHPIDVSRFPDALCNDGSPAIFYFRRYGDEAHRNDWVIQLQGGGGCGTGAACAQRWCGVLTNFGATQMVQDIIDPPLATIDGRGILSRRADNPWGEYNQVFVHYCSSDTWSGTARDVVLDTFHPCDPDVRGSRCADGSACPADGDMAGLCADQPVTFRIQFLGSRIVDAVVDTLRRDDGSVVGEGAEALPDLDAASHVILAGASGGGAGAINNLDRVAERLRETNDACQGGGACPLVVQGLIDSIVGPSMETLDWDPSRPCTEAGACSYEAFYRRVAGSPGGQNLWQGRGDESCVPWHQAHEADSEWRCSDLGHVVRSHITTPFVIRQGLLDGLISDNTLELEVGAPDGTPMRTILDWAMVLAPDLQALSDWATTAHEASPELRPPGVFAPACAKHETLSSEGDTFDATIEALGAPRHFFDLWGYWESGEPAILVSSDQDGTYCPPAE